MVKKIQDDYGTYYSEDYKPGTYSQEAVGITGYVGSWNHVPFKTQKVNTDAIAVNTSLESMSEHIGFSDH